MNALLILQSSVSSDQAHLIADAVSLGVVVGAGKIWDHVKGKRRDRASSTQLQSIHDAVHSVREEVRDLKAHVVGPDGQNGLRGDVRELKANMDELKRKGAFNTPPDFPAEKPARYKP